MKRQSRRSFFKAAGLAGAGLVTTAAQASASATAHVPNDNELGMLYDATRCVGCKACMAACKRVNADAGALAYEEAQFDPDGLWDAPEDLSGDTRTLIKLFKEGAQWSYIKYSCMHCQKASCVSVCPVKAMTKDPVTGIVDYNKDTCIGCRYCQVACPFNIPRFQWDRTVPQIVKCDLCRHTQLQSKGIPACAETCPAGAITFGKRGELLQEARNRLKEHPEKYFPHIYGEHEVGGTNHLFLAALAFTKLGLPELPSDPPAAFSERIQHTLYKGFIAPVALYAGLCFMALRNRKKGNGHAPAPAGPKQHQARRSGTDAPYRES
jgi:Fe-S-cluster-containing dehydrogenase component